MVFIIAGVGGHFSPWGGVEGGGYAAIKADSRHKLVTLYSFLVMAIYFTCNMILFIKIVEQVTQVSSGR